ncbi:MAG: hypothetical protein ACPGFA_08170 [Pikeienuella sp.]
MYDELAILSAASHALERLKKGGREVEQTTDFEKLVAEIEASPKKHVNPEMNPNASDLTSANAAYLTVREKGQLIGFCAVRQIIVGEEGLAGFLRRQFRRHYGAGQDAFEVSGLPPAAREARGPVAFIGDMYAVPKYRVDISAFAMLAYAVAATKWQPETIYNFTKNRDARRGLAAQYLNLGGYPAAIKWVNRPATRRDDDWLYIMPRETYMWLFERYAERGGDFSVT